MKWFSDSHSLSSFSFFFRYLFSKRSNSVVRRVAFVCLLGLIVSVGSLVIVLNVMGGLGRSIKKQFLAAEPHIIITLEKNPSSQFVRKQKETIQNTLRSSGLQSGVKEFYFFETLDVVVRTEQGIFSGAVARGYDSQQLKKFLMRNQLEKIFEVEKNIPDGADSLNAFAENQTTELGDDQSTTTGLGDGQSTTGLGKDQTTKQTRDHYPVQIQEIELEQETLFVIKEKETDSEVKKIAMSLGLISELGIYSGEEVSLIPAENLLLPPGEPIQFEFVQLESVISLQSESWNANTVFYDRKYFPSFSKNSSYLSGFEILLKEPESYEPYKEALATAGYTVEAWPERNSSVFFALRIEKIIMTLFLSLAGLITLLAVSSLLVLLMVQKRKDIGALMALGWPIKKVRSLFVGVGLFLCLFGVVGGILFGLLICFLIKYSQIGFLAHLYSDPQFPLTAQPWTFVVIGLTVLCFAFVSCWLSVRSQSRLSASELLKTVGR